MPRYRVRRTIEETIIVNDVENEEHARYLAGEHNTWDHEHVTWEIEELVEPEEAT